VWHASAAPVYGTFSQHPLLRCAFEALIGVGNRKKEWREWTGYAYHLRRRLTPQEQLLVGAVKDLRGTTEGIRRYHAMPAFVNKDHMRQAAREIRDPARHGTVAVASNFAVITNPPKATF
jgi:hypothetical protein